MDNHFQKSDKARITRLNPKSLSKCPSIIDIIARSSHAEVGDDPEDRNLEEHTLGKGIHPGESNCELDNRFFLSEDAGEFDRCEEFQDLEVNDIANKKTDKLPEQRNQIDKRALEFIERMEYPKIYIGRITPKQMSRLDWRIERKGKMTPQEKELFDYANRILQHPFCIQRGEQIKSTSRDTYSYAISRYLVFMAKRNVGALQFAIDGVLLLESMREYVDEKTKEGKTGDFSKTIYGAQQALAFFNHCIALYKCRDIQDRITASNEVKKLKVVPNMNCVTIFALERRKHQNELARINFHDKHRKEYTNETYTIDNLKAMMVNMYNMTGEGAKKDIYFGINAILEILLGHHLLYRGENKRQAQISDIQFTEYDSERGSVLILGFSSDRGKTNTESNKPHFMGACRHKDVEICLVTATAMSMWYRFDFEDDHAPLSGENRPDFSLTTNWSSIKVLFADSAKSKNNEPISYKYEADLVRLCLRSIGVVLGKTTHLGRQGGARKADANQVEMSQIKLAGGWKKNIINGLFSDSLPFEFIFSSGGFDFDEPYDCLRESEPPEFLQTKIFPWLESSIAAIDGRCILCKSEGEKTSEIDEGVVAKKFLRMLKTFRKVILQDLTNLIDRAPHSIFAKHPITKLPEFLRFKERIRRNQEELGLSEKMQEKRALANVLVPFFVGKVDELQLPTKKIHLSMLKHAEEFREYLETIRIHDTKEEHLNLIQQVKGAVEDQLWEVLVERSQSHDLEASPVHHKIQEPGVGSDIIEWFKGFTSERAERDENIKKLVEGFEAFDQELKKNSLKMQSVCDQVAGHNAKFIDLSIIQDVMHVDSPHHKSTKVSTERDVEPKAGFIGEANGSIQDLTVLARAVPSLRMRKDSDTVVKLLKEWYVLKPGAPSVQKKNQIYGNRWRGTSSIYKRRKVIINFIETLRSSEEFSPNASREEIGQLLDNYRVRNSLRMNGLSAKLQNAHLKELITEELQKTWSERPGGGLIRHCAER